MSITVYLEPSNPSSSKTGIYFSVTTSSTDITTLIQAKVYYRRNVNKFYRLAGTKIASKTPLTNYYMFRIDSMLDKLMTSEYNDTGSIIYTNNENVALEYYVVFSEYYPSTSFALHDSYTTNTYIAHNIGILATETQGLSDYYMTGGGSYKFLTDSPATQPIRAGEIIQLGFITSQLAPIVKVKETKNNASTSTSSYGVISKNYEQYLWDYTVNASEVVAIDAGVVLSGATGIYAYDTTNIMWGAIRLHDTGVTADSIEITLPTVIGSLPIFKCKTQGSSETYKVEYYYGSPPSWNASVLNDISSGTTFVEDLPAGTSKIKITAVSIADHIDVLWCTITSASATVKNKSCSFTLSQSAIAADTNFLEIWAETAGGVKMSETKKYLVDTQAVENATRFAWQNLRGGYDNYTFKFGYAEELGVEKVTFLKELPNGFSKADRQRGVAYVSSDLIFTAYANFDDNNQWLMQLLESKEVFVIVSNVRIAVDILTSSVQTLAKNEALQMEITWRFAHRRNV